MLQSPSDEEKDRMEDSRPLRNLAAPILWRALIGQTWNSRLERSNPSLEFCNVVFAVSLK